MTVRIEPYLLDPIAFTGALVLAPCFVALLSFWLMLIPVAAVIFGAVPYLVFGGPVFLWMVTRYSPEIGTFALGGLLAHMAFVCCSSLWTTSAPGQSGEMVTFLALWGAPFAALWGGTFAWLYESFYRDPLR